MARPRTPLTILKTRGTFRADRHGKEPKADGICPECPAFLDKEAKTEWNRVAPLLAGMGILDSGDFAILACYAEAFGEFLRLCVRIKRVGYVQAIAEGLMKVKNNASLRLLRFATALGLSPGSRCRLSVDPAFRPSAAGKARFFHPRPGAG